MKKKIEFVTTRDNNVRFWRIGEPSSILGERDYSVRDFKNVSLASFKRALRVIEKLTSGSAIPTPPRRS